MKDLDLFGQALRLRWRARQLEQKDRPWASAGFLPGSDVDAIFNSVAGFIPGNGQDTRFWTVDWSGKGCFAWRWPTLFTYVKRSRLTVAQALVDHRWTRDLLGSLSTEALGEFFQLWDEMREVTLDNSADSIRWKMAADGLYSASSAYNLFFLAKEDCPFGELLWQSRTPSRVRFFMWLALKGKCLTADNLAKRNWPHEDLCQLCRQNSEDGHHLLVDCAFTTEVWRRIRGWLGVDFPLPAEMATPLSDWWLTVRSRCRLSYRSDFDCLFMLICWIVWKERNARIFQNVSRTAQQLVQDIREEIEVWKAAGIFSLISE